MFSDARICLSGMLSASQTVWTRPGINFFFSCSNHLCMKFIMLINAKMPTTVGHLTFVSKINTICESFKQGKNHYFLVFYFL